jgi:antitoxin component of MazEF toxin-antitoxin module
MTDRELVTDIRRMGNDLAIILPASFCSGTTLKDGAEIKIVFNDRNNLEIQVNREVSKEGSCQICGQRTARYECFNCHTEACSNCFWEWGGLCNKCAGR